MTTLVRVACPAGQHYGVRVKFGTQVADIPVGGVQTFNVWGSHTLEVSELGPPAQAPVEPVEQPAEEPAAETPVDA